MAVTGGEVAVLVGGASVMRLRTGRESVGLP